MRWYFDYISPYAYLQSTRLAEFAGIEKVECVPVLFAGLLKHWGQLGPAEITPKREWTFKNIVWLAHRDGIALKLPPHHPFNPLPLLRLGIVLNNDIDVIQRLFRFVWVEGKVPQDESAFASLLAEYSVEKDTLQSDSVKSTLLANGQQALANGVFGVPTVERDQQLYWGYEATDMALAFAPGQIHSQSSEAGASLQQLMDEARNLPQGQGRKR